MKTLDKSRPYGEVFGPVVRRARYEQDGKTFDESGNLIGEEEVKEEKEPQQVTVSVGEEVTVSGVKEKKPVKRKKVAKR